MIVASLLLVPSTLQSAWAQSEMLASPSICSTFGSQTAPFCTSEKRPDRDSGSILTVTLAATTSPIRLAGYEVAFTDNYNGSFLPPLLQLQAGDVLRVRLANALGPMSAKPGHAHGAGHQGESDPTNLHTHGLIVTPNNATSASKGDGDNVFLSLKRGDVKEYNIPLPTALPASLLDLAAGIIPHPTGLYWYHAHLHGISEKQVSGGMSGLLSIGADLENVVGATEADTLALRAKSDAHYFMLRDTQIVAAEAPPAATGTSPAKWISTPDARLCGTPLTAPSKTALPDRKGFCESAGGGQQWLFTVNGQRFPTARIEAGRNGLFRIANLSASVTYQLAVVAEDGSHSLPFEVLSVDGVVPSAPLGSPGAPLQTTGPLLLMPAARAEIYIRNDAGPSTERTYIVKTLGLATGATSDQGDHWPEIQLARVVLSGSAPAAMLRKNLVLKEHVVQKPATPLFKSPAAPPAPAPLPSGCVRDINKSALEHRKVTFSRRSETEWRIKIEIVFPRDKTTPQPISNFETAADTKIGFLSFERYLNPDGTVNWNGTGNGTDADPRPPRHPCVQLRTGHAQLWQLHNPTAELHNFHIHQSKFRLANDQDLIANGIQPPPPAPNSLLRLLAAGSTTRDVVWHDTVPIAAGERVFIVINFDAEEQLGRFVFHCHILSHEDKGLMAPIEVLK